MVQYVYFNRIFYLEILWLWFMQVTSSARLFQILCFWNFCYFKSSKYIVLLLFIQKKIKIKRFFFNPHLKEGCSFLPVDQCVLEATNQAPGNGLHSGCEDSLRHVEGAMGRALTQRGLQEQDEFAHTRGIGPGRWDLLSRPQEGVLLVEGTVIEDKNLKHSEQRRAVHEPHSYQQLC